MPYGMPDIIMKGPVMEALDEMLNKKPAVGSYKQKLIDIHTQLTNPAIHIVDLMLQYGVIQPGSPSHTHLRDDWFPLAGGGWWPGLQPIEPKTKFHYAQAIQYNVDRLNSGEKRLKFDSYWVCIDEWDDSDPDEYYRVVFLPTQRQITIVIFTPSEPPPAIIIPAGMRVPEATFITRARLAVPNAGMQEIESIDVGDQQIALYQVRRLWNKVNDRPLEEE